MNNNSRSKHYFDQVSPNWDTLRKSFFPDAIREKAILASNITEGSVVADIGAGAGFITEAIKHLPISIVAIDQSSGMIEIMKKKFGHAPNIKYLQTEGEEISLPTESVDVALANMYLHHVNDPLFVISEIYRILKPGGRLVITDLDKHNHEFLISEHFDQWMGFERQDIRNWFITVGFKKISVDCTEAKCATKSFDKDKEANVSVFIARGTK